jgi:hypothetical protein
MAFVVVVTLMSKGASEVPTNYGTDVNFEARNGSLKDLGNPI